MFKKTLFTLILLFGATSQLSASECKTYGSNIDYYDGAFFFVL